MKKNIIKNLKVWPIIMSLGAPVVGQIASNSLPKTIETSFILISSNEYDGNIFDFEEISQEPIVTTAVTTTIPVTTTVTTTTKVTTTVDQYREIRELEKLSNNDLTLEELDDFIVKYSKLSHYSYKSAVEIIKENKDTIENDYNSIKGGIMQILFESASDNDILSGYCSYDKLELREMSLEEKEAIMLEMCDNLGLNSDEKLIVLAIFRWETGWGESNLCVNSNNYGGMRLGSGEFAIYQTPEYGIYRTVNCVSRHINNQKANGYTSLDSIVAGMSSSYCPSTAADWANKILGFTYGVASDYNYFEEGNVLVK